MLGLLALLVSGLFVAVVLAAGLVYSGLTRPPRKTLAWAIARSRPSDPAALGLRFETWAFRSRGMDLPAWDVTGQDPAGPVVVVTHGWGDSRLGSLSRLPSIAPHASRVVLWDLPGHGEAAGWCTLGLREPDDLRALLDHLRTDRPVVLVGVSLGAGVSLVVAREPSTISGVIIEGAYRLARTPARSVLRLASMPAGLALALALMGVSLCARRSWRGFDRASHAAKVHVPLLVLHGDSDEICPPEDARAIASSAPCATLAMIPGAGHNNLWTDPSFSRACAAVVATFIRSLPPTMESHDTSTAGDG